MVLEDAGFKETELSRGEEGKTMGDVFKKGKRTKL